MERSLTLALLVLLPAVSIAAQGVTTAMIRGMVVGEGRQPLEGRVRVTHQETGRSRELVVTHGHYLVQGLEPGGPYTIAIRAPGFIAARVDSVFLTLGESRTLDFVLQPVGARLDTVVVASRPRPVGPGTGTIISKAMIDQLPTPNRDVYDLARLVPQMSTRISLSNPGLSAAGTGFRFNSFLINGVSERTLSGGVSAAFAGGRSLPLDAIREYQVLVSPYDVRFGDFAGAMINAVTQSGTNTLRGSVFAYGRSDDIARRVADSVPPYERVQYGASLGGPIVRDRLHFFTAVELQHYTYPANGPFVGQRASATPAVPLSNADLARFDTLMRSKGLVAGTAGSVQNGNPQRNLFGRVDLALPAWNGNLALWSNYGSSDNASFSRSTEPFSLSAYRSTSSGYARTTAAQLQSALGRSGAGHNELLLSRRSEGLTGISPVDEPVIRVTVPATSGGSVTLQTGTNETAQGSRFRAVEYRLEDHLSLLAGASHLLEVGAGFERYRLERLGTNGSYGTWSFASLDDFAAGVVNRYELALGGANASVPFTGKQYSAYAGDQWQAGDRLSVVAGLRGDAVAFDKHAPFNPDVETLVGERTDRMPRARIELSPRIGLRWDVSGTGRTQVRGGAGIFTGRYPLAWAQSAFVSYGSGGGGLLRCNFQGPTDRYPPPFNPDPHSPPTACGGGYTFTRSPRGDVDLLDPNLRLMRVARSSIALERRLPWNLTWTNEALATRGLSDFVFVNLNLPSPIATDPTGRVIYGTLGTNGQLQSPNDSSFAEVIAVRNTSRNRSYQLSTRLEKNVLGGFGGFVSYTYSRVRDVQTPTRVNTRGIVAWAAARATGGRHDDLRASISSNDITHRVIAAGSYSVRWWRAPLTMSFYYVGESGRPFTYIAYGSNGKGDLNGDASNTNDPIYVPHDALDATEIRFSGLSDSVNADNSTGTQAIREQRLRAALEAFIRSRACLERQRGRIMARNSCREPWSNTTIASLRQALPIQRRELEVQVDVFNVLNLLNARWGIRREAAPQLIEHFGQTGVDPATSRPIFRFDTSHTAWTTIAAESAFQLQLALRYRF